MAETPARAAISCGAISVSSKHPYDRVRASLAVAEGMRLSGGTMPILLSALIHGYRSPKVLGWARHMGNVGSTLMPTQRGRWVLGLVVSVLAGCSTTNGFLAEQGRMAHVALSDNDPKVRWAAIETLTPASKWVVCRFEIAQGDESRIPELLSILRVYGTREIALDFVNSGQAQLHDAGAAWAREHGYQLVIVSSVNHSAWGSKDAGIPLSK
jgi:hypothetical protein